MSSAGHSITSSRPLSYKRTPIAGFEAYRVNGTPADCVALGLHNWEKIDVVLSGINLGSNLGNGIWHSGTVAGARQAVFFDECTSRLRGATGRHHGYAFSCHDSRGFEKLHVMRAND